MGSGSSKDGSAYGKVRYCSSSRRGRGKGTRSIKDRFFGSACLCPRHVSSNEENEGMDGKMKVKPCKDKLVCGHDNLNDSEDVKYPRANFALTNNIARLGENRENMSQMKDSDCSSASENATSSNSLVRFRSHFGFFHSGSVFRFGRPASGVSSCTHPNFSCSLSIPCAKGVSHVHRVADASSDNSCMPSVESVTGAASAGSNSNFISGVGDYSHTNLALSDILGVRLSQNRSQEPPEGTARFGRSRSVGRLRDRVLRRASLSEGRVGVVISVDEAQEYAFQDSRRLVSAVEIVENVSSTNRNDEAPSTSMSRLSGITRMSENNHNLEPEDTISREPDSRETLEYRLAFLERRRRIRSQVRALQRLGSRFENSSGHDRSCILSGQHRTGRCSCRTTNHSINSSDDTSTRASISRIVMLAEALFEVLDEIHQQAVVLASRSSLSSIGAVPAPKEVVDCMPVKVFTESQKCQIDEAAQCHICLVEYEEGDCMRILPCSHEFHQACVDKWLKEIHRVCPLCRGDVCISDVSHVDEHESST